MRFTDTIPTEPGWYWYKPPGWTSPLITQVYLADGKLTATLAGHRYPIRAVGSDYVWAGPIPEPEDGDYGD